MTTRPCLLLVDDTSSNLDVLVSLLEDSYDLKIATRGEKALALSEAPGSVDLVLLDVMMPGLDGFEVCRQMRARPATAAVPIIFLTAKNAVEDIVQGFECGGNDYLTKPVRPEELRARVRTHLLVRAQQEEIEQKNTALKSLIHVLSHDIANHFASVAMCLDLMDADPTTTLESMKPLMHAAASNGLAITRVIHQLRRAEDKPLELVPVHLPTAVNESLLLLSGKMQQKKIGVVQDIADVRVLAEPVILVNSVINNVLTNAIKFSPIGSALSMSARLVPEGVCLAIKDPGVGISADDLARLFDMGKSHSRPGTEGEVGTGFGMPLMQRFVGRFGGRVEVSSRTKADAPTDHGTEFRLFLKLA